MHETSVASHICTVKSLVVNSESQVDAFDFCLASLNIVPNLEVSDTTGDATCTKADFINKKNPQVGLPAVYKI